MTTAKTHLENQLKLIMSLDQSQLDLYTRDTMFKCIEDLSGGICWGSSLKIDETGALLTPSAFLRWSEYPDKTLSKVIDMKVKGGDSLTKEHFGGVHHEKASAQSAKSSHSLPNAKSRNILRESDS